MTAAKWRLWRMGLAHVARAILVIAMVADQAYAGRWITAVCGVPFAFWFLALASSKLNELYGGPELAIDKRA